MALSVEDARRLLESRKARGAPDYMVASAERELQEAIAAAQGGKPQEPHKAASEHPKWLVYVVGLVGCFLAGMLLGKAIRSGTIGFAGRSLVRGAIYRGIRSF